MKIVRHGDVLVFECKECGCVFTEAVKKTDLENAGVFDPVHGTGTRHECPDCGCDVMGFKPTKETECDTQ